MTKSVMLHAGAVVIAPFTELARTRLSDVEIQHLLDDRIVADLGRGAAEHQISGFAGELSDAIGIPVFGIDEAMADHAVRQGSRIGVVATLETMLRPTSALLHERAQAAGRQIITTELIVPGAFEAVAAGDGRLHDQLVAAAITELSARTDVIVLAQASMTTAAAGATTDVPALSSPEPGIDRIASLLPVTSPAVEVDA